MSTKRRVGWSLSAVSALLWIVLGWIVITADPAGGASIGGGLIFMVAFPLTFVSSFVLASARREETRARMNGAH